jgi:cytochrome c oxidase subunit II
MVSMLPILAETGGNFWLPPQASSIAPEVDNLFYGIFWLSVFFFVLITFMLVLFAIKYRYVEGKPAPADAPKHNTALELTWTFIPTVLVIVIFYYGFVDYMHMSVPPRNADTTKVHAQMWSYSFEFPNGDVEGDLYVPKNVPIVFHMDSADVIHGFFIPAFRIKKDIVPMRDNILWVEATQTGDFDLYCTQYCGKQHSEMRRKVHVMDADAYYDFLAHSDEKLWPFPWQYGYKKVYVAKGCISCHSIDGSKGVGPTWQGIWGSTVHMQDGTSHMVDAAYVKHMVLFPNEWKLDGFPNPAMPKIELNDRQLNDVIQFISSPDKEVEPPTTEPSATAAPAAAPK